MFLSERSIASATCSPSSMIAKYCFPPLRPRGQFKSSKFLRCCLHNNPDPGHGTTNLPSLWGALFSQSSNSCFIVYRRHSPSPLLFHFYPKRKCVSVISRNFRLVNSYDAKMSQKRSIDGYLPAISWKNFPLLSTTGRQYIGESLISYSSWNNSTIKYVVHLWDSCNSAWPWVSVLITIF